MAEIVLACSRCEQPLRVPEEMQGRLVKCPACGMTFTVQPGETLPLEISTPDRPGQDYEASPPTSSPPHSGPQVYLAGDTVREQASRTLMPPAICLLLLSIPLCLFSSLAVYQVFANPELQKRQALEFMRRFRQQLQIRMNPQEEQEFGDRAVVTNKIIYVTALAFSLITALGAAQMLRLRTYWLGVIGSVLAMFNIGCCSCLLGFPFGLWALVLLMRPEVREAFR